MRSITEFENIFIHKLPVDLRKSINGLSIIVSEEMGLDLKASSLFVFTNRRRSHMKILYFDNSGFALWLKRLEGTKFSWPKNFDEDVGLPPKNYSKISENFGSNYAGRQRWQKRSIALKTLSIF